jgi:hypothetical protein
VLGPIQQVAAGDLIAPDPIDQQQEQQEAQAEKKSDKKEEADDSGVDASLGLINTGPVQLKTDLEQPVTSGGMDTLNVDPGTPD